MGKHGSMDPKAVWNRVKAKGLTKLRWYCQLCEKACRDENGYKCHTQSESHLRQVETPAWLLFCSSLTRPALHTFSGSMRSLRWIYFDCRIAAAGIASQVRVFSETPEQFIEFYSKEFEDAYMEVLRRKGENVGTCFCSVAPSCFRC